MVLNRAEAVDFNAHHVAGLQELRRLRGEGNARRRASVDDIAGLQGQAASI